MEAKFYIYVEAFLARVHDFIAKRVKWVHGTQRAKTCADGNTEVGLGFGRSGN